MCYLLQGPELLLTQSKEGCRVCSLDAHFNGSVILERASASLNTPL